jgi:hypothetical protein
MKVIIFLKEGVVWTKKFSAKRSNMKKKMLFSMLCIFFGFGLSGTVLAQITELTCKHEDGTYWGMVKIDLKLRTLKETNELMRLVAKNMGNKYEGEPQYTLHSITYISDSMIRTNGKVPIEIDRRSLRMRWIRPAPPDWVFDCVKSEKAF